MQEGMYVVGVKPKSLGEGVIPIVYTVDYERAWQYWDDNPGHSYGIYLWTRGALVAVGRKHIDKKGRTHWIPIPPVHIKITA